jgi:hypothetical protein
MTKWDRRNRRRREALAMLDKALGLPAAHHEATKNERAVRWISK